MKIELIKTCEACPEQYDAYLGDEIVGYLRLRHGHFTVQFPNPTGEVVYESEVKGDGIFEWDERGFHLDIAKRVILANIIKREGMPTSLIGLVI